MMRLTINKEAYRVVLNVLLSCRCPVTAEIEENLTKLYKNNLSGTFDYDEIIKIVNDFSDNTVFHRLKEFYLFTVDDFSNCEIKKNDTLRHFCTSYHWMVVENALPMSYKNILTIPSHFVGHMLLPVKTKNIYNSNSASYNYLDKKILLKNLFIPHDIDLNLSEYCAVHFASIICSLNERQYTMINNQLIEIPDFVSFANDIKEIDYKKWQKHGNYMDFCKERYSKYF